MSFLKTWIRNSTTKIFIWKGFILMVTSQDFIQTQKLQLQTVYATLNRIVWRYFRRGFIDWYSHTTAWFRRIIIARFHNWPLRRKYLLCFSFSFHFRIGSYLKTELPTVFTATLNKVSICCALFSCLPFSYRDDEFISWNASLLVQE